jgi:hypothetical protein
MVVVVMASREGMSASDLYLERYHELFEKYEKRFEGNSLGLPAYKLADMYANERAAHQTLKGESYGDSTGSRESNATTS